MSRVSEEQNTPSERPGVPQLSNLAVRVLTALIFMPLALFGAYVGGLLWLLLAAAITIVGVLEFYIMAHGRQSQGSTMVGIPVALAVLLAFYVEQPIFSLLALVVGAVVTFALGMLRHPDDLRRTLWQVMTTLCGVLYVGFPLAFLIALRALPEGFLWLLVVFAATWGTDTFAYFGGRLWGKHKLAPKLSPKKTIEGAVVGIVGGFLSALLFLVIGNQVSVASLMLIALTPLVAILGDLLESALKRFFQVKDSRITGLNIFPGHGGVLDRIDSLLMVAAFTYLFIQLTGIG